MRRRRYIFVSRGLVPQSGSYPRSKRTHYPFPGGDLCHKSYINSSGWFKKPLTSYILDISSSKVAF